MEKFPHTYRMDLAFNGSNYGGWQRQTDGTLSVQEVVENVLRRITGEVFRHTRHKQLCGDSYGICPPLLFVGIYTKEQCR